MRRVLRRRETCISLGRSRTAIPSSSGSGNDPSRMCCLLEKSLSKAPVPEPSPSSSSQLRARRCDPARKDPQPN